jgi:hypothetical protein
MPRPSATTAWPTANDLKSWLGDHAVSHQVEATLFAELVAEASTTVLELVDPRKLPADEDDCPRGLHRAIVLEAARLLFRRQAPHGVAAFGEVAIRLRTADADVERLVGPYAFDGDLIPGED